MKNKFYYLLLFVALFSFSATTLKAQNDNSPTASKEIYDWTPFDDVKMVNLFEKAIQKGREYPTREEFIEIFGFDIEFVRSHVRPAKVLVDRTKQVNPTINPDRNLWMNIPGGIGKGSGGFQSSLFNNDVYSMWQYTNLFGSWNHGLFQASGAWADAAHKHGTDIFSGIKFFEGWTPGSGDANYTSLIATKNADGTFKYAEAFINCLMYLGLDGINYNWEDRSYGNSEVIAFHKELFRIAKEKGFENFHIGLYTQNSSLQSTNANSLYYGHDPKDKTIDLMLNYSSGDFAFGRAPESIGVAKNIAGNTKNLYQGVWIVNMDRAWPAMNTESRKEMGLCLWGEHAQSRFVSYNAGPDGFGIQENYQKLLERAFSGGNRNPANLPPLKATGNNWEQEGDKEPLSTFGGLATMIAERPTVQGKLPFVTNFQLGNGERYNYKGKKAFGSWYNMGTQDYQPTYRWLVYDAGTQTVSKDIQPSYTHRDAYNGGSALYLEGTATTKGTDIVLYRTDLEVSAANPKLNIAIKNYKDGVNATHLYLILKKKNTNNWIAYPIGDTNSKNWEEKTIDMADFSTQDHIEYIGLRVKSDSEIPNYSLYVGKIGLSDDRQVKVANVENLMVEVKEETQGSMSLKMNWSVTPFVNTERSQSTGLVYNDEANVGHFEILYKNGAEGRVKEIGRTSTWANFIGNIVFEDRANEEPYIGVRAASVDGKNYSTVSWVKVARAASTTVPPYVDDRYCKSEINTLQAGADIARVQRYLTVVKTTGLTHNLDYTADAPQADGTQYVDATNKSLTANQGETFDFFFKAFEAGDGLKWCFAKAYVDWDNNGEFDPATEEVFDLGKVRKGTPEFQDPGVTKSFTVPSDAAPGAVRLRIVFSDAWFTHPGPCGGTAKGFSIDFTMNITGTNPPRVSEDIHDKGIPDEPNRIHDENPNYNDGSGIENVSEGNYSTFYPNPVKDVLQLENVQQIWIYTLDGKLLYGDKGNISKVDVSDLTPGMYIVKMLNENVVRSKKLIKE